MYQIKNLRSVSQIYKDTNQIKVIKQLRKDIAILKSDKGNGVVLRNNKD